MFGQNRFELKAALFGCGLGVLGATPAWAASFSLLHSFTGSKGEGADPVSLIYEQGALYGVTAAGGEGKSCVLGAGCGTVFSATLTGDVTTLHQFGNKRLDGAMPLSLIDVDGTFYGTTAFGGRAQNCPVNFAGCGTVFSIPPGGKESVLYSFKGNTNRADGSRGNPGLVRMGHSLYGTTFSGGSGTGCQGSIGCGTVYKVGLRGSEKVLYSFQSSGGFFPENGLVRVGHMLFGTTYNDAGGNGTVYQIAPDGTETVLHTFNGTDGTAPVNLIASGGVLYGVTAYGGNTGCGTLFKITDGQFSEIHAFQCSTEGARPYGLAVDNGTIYGTTKAGGAANAGTVYAVSDTGAVSVVYAFQNTGDGDSPGEIIFARGALYGVTDTGGGTNRGALYRITF